MDDYIRGAVRGGGCDCHGCGYVARRADLTGTAGALAHNTEADPLADPEREDLPAYTALKYVSPPDMAVVNGRLQL